MLRRRSVLGAALAAPALIRAAQAAEPRQLRLSHHFPISEGDHGDLRDRLARRFAAEVAARSQGALSIEIYAGATLMRPAAQFSGLRHGALDLTVCPLAFGAHEIAEAAVGMVPCLLTTDAQAAAWKDAPAGRRLATALLRRGVRILSWVWLPVGIAARQAPIAVPSECQGLRVRSGSPAMAETLRAAGARSAPLLAEAVGQALRKGQIDAAIVSSTSMLSFRMQQAATAVTTARLATCGYSLEPLMISEQSFVQLSREQQATLIEAGAAQDAFAAEAARVDANTVGEVFAEAGVAVHDLDQADLQQWVKLAVDTGWRNFAAGSTICAELLRLAVEVPA